MVSMEWDPDYVPGVKLGLHSFQIILSFTVWCLEIATFVAKDAKIVGNNAWTFSVVCLDPFPHCGGVDGGIVGTRRLTQLQLAVLPVHSRMDLPDYDAALLPRPQVRRAARHARR